MNLDAQEPTRRLRVDPTSPGTVIYTCSQDAEPILEANDLLRNAPRPSSRLHHSGMETWYRVASIPLGLVEKWFIETGLNVLSRHHWPELKKKLNDLEWERLRTAPGRL
jgi:hypothetical protein